jgi:asparagine synthase (glutamine-hydrolysing)
MAAIAGITVQGASSIVSGMLEKMSHRGKDQISIIEKNETTYGISWDEFEDKYVSEYLASDKICDFKGSCHYAWARPEKGSFILYRDELGVAPLYYGWDQEGIFYFASEVKALLPYISRIIELQPGCEFNGRLPHPYFELKYPQNQNDAKPEQIALKLRKMLENSVKSYIRSDNIGSWLSGGLDSSTICAIASKHIKKLQTFAAGLRDAPDLEYAREVSRFIKSQHHEVVVSVNEMIKSLPEVIYHLESFDALLVRSSITNFIVSKKASQFVSEVFSGEGGDELFAGYEYLKSLPENQLPSELIKITKNLHNTALQRVDRCSSGNGIVAYVAFLHPEVVNYAFSIPVKYKLHKSVEKWILRKAIEGDLPEKVLNRPKAKFWEGAGVREVISSYANEKIKNKDFNKERRLYNGWILNTREELLYYRIFRDHFGSDLDLHWMGRTES